MKVFDESFCKKVEVIRKSKARKLYYFRSLVVRGTHTEEVSWTIRHKRLNN